MREVEGSQRGMVNGVTFGIRLPELVNSLVCSFVTFCIYSLTAYGVFII